MTDFLTVIEVLAIHADQIEKYGGAVGIRDLGLLEAALFRPQTGYYDGLMGQAAALWESLSQNHPFVDGNKRTGFAATYTFLAINGGLITADPLAIHAFMAGLDDTGTFDFVHLSAWLKDHVTIEPARPTGHKGPPPPHS